MVDLSQMAQLVREEAHRAHEKYGHFKSTHEGYGVLAEEVTELLDAIRMNCSRNIMNEAIQVSAVALRLADICDREIASQATEFGERSGL